MLAGLGGVLLALAFRHIVPETFGVLLADRVPGHGRHRRRSARPAAPLAGALFVSSLPVVLQRYSDALPFVTETPTGGGMTAGVAARFCYGAAIVVLLLVEPGGLAALGRRAAAGARRAACRRPRRRPAPDRALPHLQHTLSRRSPCPADPFPAGSPG